MISFSENCIARIPLSGTCGILNLTAGAGHGTDTDSRIEVGLESTDGMGVEICLRIDEHASHGRIEGSQADMTCGRTACPASSREKYPAVMGIHSGGRIPDIKKIYIIEIILENVSVSGDLGIGDWLIGLMPCDASGMLHRGRDIRKDNAYGRSKYKEKEHT